MNTRELLHGIGENLSVRRSFGTAYERGEVLVIPVAFVAGGGGGGEGPIKPTTTRHTGAILGTEPGEGAPSDGQPPTGEGGGFGGMVWPVGVYVVKGDQVRWVPTYDVNLIVLAALTTVRVLVSLLKRRRPRHHA